MTLGYYLASFEDKKELDMVLSNEIKANKLQ